MEPRQKYDTFVEKCIECATPELSDIQAARQQFIDESDDNVLKEQLLHCLQPFIDEVEDKDVPWWGLIMCSLFEIHQATIQLGVCNEN